LHHPFSCELSKWQRATIPAKERPLRQIDAVTDVTLIRDRVARPSTVWRGLTP